MYVDTLVSACVQSSYMQELDLDDALKSPDAFYEFFSIPNPFRTEACNVYHCTCYIHASCVICTCVHACFVDGMTIPVDQAFLGDPFEADVLDIGDRPIPEFVPSEDNRYMCVTCPVT